jgi:putative membrane protein
LLNYLIARVKPVKRLFITGREMDEEVAEAAVASFYNNGLYKTRDETGILIYISIFEKRIWILADRGINEKVEQSEWDETVRIIREGIKSGRQGEAIVTAVKKAGEILTRHFPARRDDRDELSNLIMKD